MPIKRRNARCDPRLRQGRQSIATSLKAGKPCPWLKYLPRGSKVAAGGSGCCERRPLLGFGSGKRPAALRRARATYARPGGGPGQVAAGSSLMAGRKTARHSAAGPGRLGLREEEANQRVNFRALWLCNGPLAYPRPLGAQNLCSLSESQVVGTVAIVFRIMDAMW